MQDTLRFYGHSFSSRILLGTARYESPTLLVEAINAAVPAMVTVALRRQIQGGLQAGQSFWEVLRTANLGTAAEYGRVLYGEGSLEHRSDGTRSL